MKIYNLLIFHVEGEPIGWFYCFGCRRVPFGGSDPALAARTDLVPRGAIGCRQTRVRER